MLRHAASLAIVCGALALSPGAPDARPAGPTGPEGISAADWAGIRAAYEAGRHAAFAAEGGYQARNPGQRWLTRFDGRGFSAEPDSGAWTWGLELLRYGFEGAERPVSRPARTTADGQRVAYDWDPALQEWYVNDQRGLEHGYTLRQRPPPGGGDLTLALGVRGSLRPEVEADGRGVRFIDAGGSTVLTYAGLLVSDARGRSLAARFEPSRDGLLLAIDERDAAYPLTVDPIAQQAYIKASNTNQGDLFGSAVAVSGNTAVVGAFAEASSSTGVNGVQSNNDAPFAGAAYVFVRSGSTWSQQAYLKASNTEAGDLFAASVAISDDTIVIGAQNESSSATGVNGDQFADTAGAAGAAYVFVRNGSTWSQQAYLKASNTDPIDHFGYQVAVLDDTIAVAAISEDSLATGVNGDQGDNDALSSGAVYVFTRTGTTWSQQAYVKASNTEQGDEFGFTVALSGQTLVVAADDEDSAALGVNGNQLDNTALGAGAIYVFVRSGTTWSQQAYIKASNTETADRFGWSASISGDTLAVGAIGEDSKVTGINGNQGDNQAVQSGAAYVFVRSGTTWSQQAYIKASNTGAQDGFGFALGLSGESLVVGAQGEDSNATGINGSQNNNSEASAGAAYLFRRTGTTWAQFAYIKASNTQNADVFGIAVGLDGDLLVVGAQGEASNASGINGTQTNNQAGNAGAAYAFDLDLDAWGDLGSGLAGVAGVPSLTGTGPMSAGSSNQFVLTQAKPSSLAWLVLGAVQLNAPFKGGTMVPQPAQLVVFTTDPGGNVVLPFTFPAGLPAGIALYFQFWIADPAGVAGFSASNGLRGVTA